MRLETVEDYYANLEEIGAFAYVADVDGDIYQQADYDGLFWIMGDDTPMPVEDMCFPLTIVDIDV